MGYIRLLNTSVVLLASALSMASVAAGQGYVRAEGKYIVDGNNQPLILRGMGLGGWMLQEGYMLELGKTGTQRRIRQAFTDLIGPQRTEEFYQAWLDNFISKADIDAMAHWGYNSVRLPMHYNLFTLPIEDEPVAGQQTWLTKGFEMVDDLLAWSKANNIYLILDLHAAPGGQGHDNNISDRDPNLPSLWQSEANQQKTIALWQELARRYKDEPMIAAYDIINEPNWGFSPQSHKHGCGEQNNQPLGQLLRDITAAIRSVDKQHMIIVEGNCWGNNYEGIELNWDDNMVISFHKYWNDTSSASIQGQLALRDKYQKPLWLGESGENSNQWFAETIAMAEQHDIGWAFWPLKKIRMNNPLQVVANPAYLDIVNYLENGGPRPEAERAYQALMQLTQDVKFANNIQHRAVIDAMLIQPHHPHSRPFKKHQIGQHSYIQAVDYDLGGEGRGYSDQLSVNISTQAGGARWNNGMLYRNDGVDIQEHNKQMIVTDFAPGEWLQYSIEADKAGDYVLSVETRLAAERGEILISVNGDSLNAGEVAASQQFQMSKLANIQLLEGNNVLKVTNSGEQAMSLQRLSLQRLSAPSTTSLSQ